LEQNAVKENEFKIADKGITVRGRIKFRVMDEHGNVIHEHEQDNLILNGGLDIWPLILSGAANPALAVIRAGSDATTPAVTQTDVLAFLGEDSAPLKEAVGPAITFHGLIGSVTGTIREVALWIDGTGVARQLVSPEIIMSGLRRVTIEWTFTFGRVA
jgi:hypothetical protein